MFTDDRITQLDRDSIAFVNSRTDQALWYAWGQIDALRKYGVKLGDILTLDDGWAFAHHVYVSSVSFRLGTGGMLTSVVDQWADYLKRKQGVATVSVLHP